MVARSSSLACASRSPSMASRSAWTSVDVRCVNGTASLRTSCPNASTPAASSRSVWARPRSTSSAASSPSQPGSFDRVQHGPEQRADGHRGVLQRLEPLAQAGTHVRRADGPHVEPPALLGVGEGGPDPGDLSWVMPPRLVQPAPSGRAPAPGPRPPGRRARRRRAIEQLAERGRPARRWRARRRRWRPWAGTSRLAAMPTAAPDQRLGDPLPGRGVGAERRRRRARASR